MKRIVGGGAALGLALAGWGLTRSVTAEAAVQCVDVPGVLGVCTVNEPGNHVVGVTLGSGLGTYGVGLRCVGGAYTDAASVAVLLGNSVVYVPLGNGLDPYLCAP